MIHVESKNVVADSHEILTSDLYANLVNEPGGVKGLLFIVVPLPL